MSIGALSGSVKILELEGRQRGGRYIQCGCGCTTWIQLASSRNWNGHGPMGRLTLPQACHRVLRSARAADTQRYLVTARAAARMER